MNTPLISFCLALAGTIASKAPTAGADAIVDRARLFDQKIDAVDAEAPDDNTDKDGTLWESRTLKQMYSRPKVYLPDVEVYLRRHAHDRQLDERKIKIAILVLQCLPLDGDPLFLNRLARAGHVKIAPRALLYAVFPGVEWSTRLQMEYKRSDVRATLKRVAASPNVDKNVGKSIAIALDGRAAKYLLDNHEKPLLACPARGAGERRVGG